MYYSLALLIIFCSIATPSFPPYINIFRQRSSLIETTAMDVQRRTADLIASMIPESNRWKADKEIDFENTDIRGRVIPQHVGRIAAVMTDWEDSIADGLGLIAADRADIVERYPRKPSLQRYDDVQNSRVATNHSRY